MNTDEDGNSTDKAFQESNIVVIDDLLEPVDPKKYEIIDHEGSEARFYPATGAIMVFSEEWNRWIIRANRGGRPDFDGAAMVQARELKKEKAILDGLENAAEGLDMRGASAMLALIVESRAKNAVSDSGRTGNADAKFIFSLIGESSEGEQAGPAVRIDMDADTAEGFIKAMKEMMQTKMEAE